MTTATAQAGRRLLLCPSPGPVLARRHFGEVMHATETPTPTTVNTPTTTRDKVRPLSAMKGPIAWPLVGNFWAYVKKENRGRLHEFMASLTILLLHFSRVFFKSSIKLYTFNMYCFFSSKARPILQYGRGMGDDCGSKVWFKGVMYYFLSGCKKAPTCF